MENVLGDLMKMMSINEIKYTFRFLEKSLSIGGSKSVSKSAISQIFCERFDTNKVWFKEVNLNFLKNKLNMTCDVSDLKTLLPEMLNKIFEMSPLEKSNLFSSLNENHTLSFSIQPNNDKIYKTHEKSIKKLMSEFPDLPVIIDALIMFGDIDMCFKICSFRPGIPCQPMLAKPTKGFDDVKKRTKGKEISCEYKYDGLRGQVHIFEENGEQQIKIFSRNLDDLTETYGAIIPPLKEFATENKIKNIVLDGEIMAIEKTSKKILPFQSIMKVSDKTDKIISYFYFDILYLNDQNLISQNFSERLKVLNSFVNENNPDAVQKARGFELKDLSELKPYLITSVNDGCEGLMIKLMGEGSHYFPSDRSSHWLKLKKDYISKLGGGFGDSFDLVVMGAMYGKGKRANKFGSFLVGCYNSENDLYESCCLIGTGFKDEDLDDFYELLKDRKLKEIPDEYEVSDKLKIDCWFSPKLVFEIKIADIQVSPIHTCGITISKNSKGIGMRFPRFVRKRTDKKEKNATTSQQIYQMFSDQAILNL